MVMGVEDTTKSALHEMVSWAAASEARQSTSSSESARSVSEAEERVMMDFYRGKR
jgi:hypothetical protein